MTCDRKIPYASRRLALDALGFMRRRPGYEGGLNVYRCECGAWHLGRQDKSIKLKVKEK